MQKKKILFVMESLRIGGAEKSLLTILSMFDYDKYDVDLFLFRQNGELMSFLSNSINLLQEDSLFKCFDESRKLSPIKYLKKGEFNQAFHANLYLLNVLNTKMHHKELYVGWNHQKHFFTPITKHYDVAVAFLERRTIYYVADFVFADKKIGFIHNDYSVYPYDEKEDMRCFKEFDYIATVSEHCKQVLCNKFPMYSKKFTVIKNMVSRELICNMAQEPIPNFKKDVEFLYLCSVGRLTAQKGFDKAIEICCELIKSGAKVKWFIIGDGEQKDFLIQKISEHNLKESFILIGADVNPYRWMKMCDVYVQPSRFEGYGITVAEAKVLNKKIVASNIPEFQEQLRFYSNAVLVDKIEDYVTLILSICNKEDSFCEKEEQKEMDKLYAIINN